MPSVPHPTAAAISAVREALLALHKSLIDVMREEHERRLGRRIPPGELLQLLTGDEAFDWLHPFSQLIVAIDEMLELPDRPTEEDAGAVRLEVDQLVHVDRTHYHALVDAHVSVALEHGRTTELNSQLPAFPVERHAHLRGLRATWREEANRPRRSLRRSN